MASGRRSPSEVRQARERRRAFAVIGVAAVLLGAVGALWWRANSIAVKRDLATLCPVDTGPRGDWFVVVDASEPFTLIQRADILNRLEMVVDREVSTDELVSVYVLDANVGDPSLPAPAFARCKPPVGETSGTWLQQGLDQATQNLRLQHQKWLNDFKGPVAAALDVALSTAPAPNSPIMETIQAVVVQRKARATANRKPTLVLISDLLQHSDLYSRYGNAPQTFGGFLQTPQAPHLLADLHDFEVRVFFVRRANSAPLQGQALLEFWAEYFSRCGIEPGALVVDPITG